MDHLIHLYNLPNRFNDAMRWNVKYDLGAKFTNIDKNPPGGFYVDCSGFIRWLVLHGSDMVLRLPDGSYNQIEAIEAQGFPRRNYWSALTNRTGAIYIAFFKPAGRLPGHVWLLQNGRTMESYSGKGIGSRNGKILGLMMRPVYCYRLS